MEWYTACSIAAVVVVAYLSVYLTIWALSHTPRASQQSEKQYVTNDAKGGPIAFTSGDLAFSLVIPCYNETKRLGIMLDEAVPVLESQFKDSYEVILVDDGSKDGTAEYALEWATKNGVVPGVFKVCQLAQNRGKGGAVTHGMRFVQGQIALFADADGASKFEDMLKLKQAIDDDKASVAIGSRAHMVNTDVVVKRSFIRNFLMYGLHTLVFIFGIRTVGDTQCGFKMFTKEATRKIFPYMHTEGWIFDVEVLMIALKKKLKVREVAISWHEVDGSKVDIARDSILMAVDLVVTRIAYILGVYNELRLTHTD